MRDVFLIYITDNYLLFHKGELKRPVDTNYVVQKMTHGQDECQKIKVKVAAK